MATRSRRSSTGARSSSLRSASAVVGAPAASRYASGSFTSSRCTRAGFFGCASTWPGTQPSKPPRPSKSASCRRTRSGSLANPSTFHETSFIVERSSHGEAARANRDYGPLRRSRWISLHLLGHGVGPRALRAGSGPQALAGGDRCSPTPETDRRSAVPRGCRAGSSRPP